MIELDPQIAAQFLGTIAQVSATIFAIYLALITIILQDKELSKIFLKGKLYLVTFSLVFLCYSVLLSVSLWDFFRLRLGEQFSDFYAFSLFVGFVFSLAALSLNFFLLLNIKKCLIK